MYGTLGFLVFDPYYLLFVALPLLVLSGLASLWLRSSYKYWSRVGNSMGITGREAALRILNAEGLTHVRVEETSGYLSDHYDPSDKVVRLSPDIYHGTSIASVGVAAHEVGHALQDARHYAPLVIRNLAVPLASLGSGLGYFVIIIGVMMSATLGGPLNLVSLIGLGLIAAVVLFQLINLPVEFDASHRALKYLPAMGIVSAEENSGVRRVLTAAAFTYVAATVAAIVELVYWAAVLGLFGRRDD
jgi:Zn-dependent membrane protease YugP